MARVIFKNEAKNITIEDCVKTFQKGMPIYFEDGKDVIFDISGE